MRRAFTFIELVFASAISVVVMTALFVMFMGLMRLVKEASDEMQVVLKARALRERLFYNALTADGVVYGGLLTARNVAVNEFGITADLRYTDAEGNPAWRLAETLSDEFTFEKSRSVGPVRAEIAAESILYAYLTVEMGQAERFRYKDRVVIPLVGKTQTLPSGVEYGPLDEDGSYFHVKDSVFGRSR